MRAATKHEARGRAACIYSNKHLCSRTSTSAEPTQRSCSAHCSRFFAGSKLVPLRTHLMVPDALTKGLPSPARIKHRDIMLGHVPFSFTARTLRSFIGGGLMIPLSLSLSLSTCRDRGSLSCGDRGSFSNMRNSKGSPYIFVG